MSEPRPSSGVLRSALTLGVVVALAVVGVVLVRSNSSESDRDRNVAGGSDVAISGAPYQVALLSYKVGPDGTTDGSGLACGGAIIAAKWVLTADHCIWRDSAGRVYPNFVVVGTGDSRYWTTINSSTARTATRILPARGVAGAWPNADLLLIEVNRPFEFSAAVRPAALPIGLDNATWPAEGSTGLITGWGATLDNAARTTLRGVTMKVNAGIRSEYCIDDSSPPRGFYWPSTFISAQHLCLLRPTRDVMASACSGDSGGPFAMTVGDRTVLAGIASKAVRDPNQPVVLNSPVCTGSTPNLYERVASALDWIIPGPVVGLSAETSGGVATISWEPSAKAPAAATDDYVIEYRTTGVGEWSILNDGTSTATTATIENLANGTNLEVRVAGVNAVNALDPTMRQFSTVSFVVGAAATTTTTSTTTSTTTTTLAPYTTTIAPSTTARQMQIGPRPTTTTTTTAVAPPAPPTAAPATTVALAPQTTQPATKPAAVEVVKVNVEDPGFSQPKVTVPAGTPLPSATQATTPPVAAKPSPAVGVSLTALQIAEITGNTVPKGSSATVSVAKGSAKVCRTSGAGISFLAKGKCRATLRVGAKPGSLKKKNVTLNVP